MTPIDLGLFLVALQEERMGVTPGPGCHAGRDVRKHVPVRPGFRDIAIGFLELGHGDGLHGLSDFLAVLDALDAPAEIDRNSFSSS